MREKNWTIEVTQHKRGPKVEVVDNEWPPRAICHVYASGRINTVRYQNPVMEHAALLASAPRLLEACQLAASYLQALCANGPGLDLEAGILEQLTLAIEQARGETPII